MNLPFSVEQFLEVFAAYNNAVWPLQVVLNVMALVAIFLAIRPSRHSDRTVSSVLGFLWLWMGAVYHIAFFAPINPAAYGFGGLFILQAVLFLWSAVRNKITYRASLGWPQFIGGVLILYGLVLYPALGSILGHAFPRGPSFGVPCPTTIFTFGILLFATGVPRSLLVIPALWSVIGFTAALTLGIQEDIGLLVSGVLGTAIILTTKPQTRTSPASESRTQAEGGHQPK